jgi:hypothetical protein
MILPFLGREKILQKGDFVMMKKEYKKDYPFIPTSLALKIEDIQEKKAKVAFISSSADEIRKEIVPVYALKKVN